MKVLILNSGRGKRMQYLTDNQPKCLTKISAGETILDRQLRLLEKQGIQNVIITTGYLSESLVNYCETHNPGLNIDFIENPRFDTTNYIYSIYLAKELLQNSDLLLLHGDLVFSEAVLSKILYNTESCVAVRKESALPEKDFKAVIEDDKIVKIGVEFFENACELQPIYKVLSRDWNIWEREITEYCENGYTSEYAETAFNTIADKINMKPLDLENLLCQEIDNFVDLEKAKQKIKAEKSKSVYACFSTDVVHGGHIRLIERAADLGKLTVGLLSDKAVASFKRFPVLNWNEREEIFQNIKGVEQVVKQEELDYADNLRYFKPDYVVHGTDWQEGPQKPLREKVISVLKEYGGHLVEYPPTESENYLRLEKQNLQLLAMPDIRRKRLRNLLEMKNFVNVMEAHSGITGLIVENTKIHEGGKIRQFDAMWVSSLCDSTAKGKPDIELVDFSSRLRTIDDIMEVTTKPIILDGDTGGIIEHFVYTVRTLERVGVSAVIIEDKTGLKKNSLFGTEVEQKQEEITKFCEKIHAGKHAQKTKEFMIIARIESLILEKGMDDALARAYAYVKAGADGIMIHSRKREPDEVFEFIKCFRENDKVTPIVVVPTSFNSVTEEELQKAGVNVVIYANQLTRSSFPAMQKTAESILQHHRAMEADAMCMPIKEIISLIPDEV